MTAERYYFMVDVAGHVQRDLEARVRNLRRHAEGPDAYGWHYDLMWPFEAALYELAARELAAVLHDRAPFAPEALEPFLNGLPDRWARYARDLEGAATPSERHPYAHVDVYPQGQVHRAMQDVARTVEGLLHSAIRIVADQKERDRLRRDAAVQTAPLPTAPNGR